MEFKNNDFVLHAENVIKKIIDYDNETEKYSSDSLLTTSKIRKVMELCSELYSNVLSKRKKYVKDNKLTKESFEMLQNIRLRLVYEAGRDKNVKKFVNESSLLEYLSEIKVDSWAKQYINFYHYLEALVAYHRFYGGSEV